MCTCPHVVCVSPFLQEQCGTYTFIPYVVSPQGKAFACDATIMMSGIKDLMQPSFQLEPLLTPLVERMVHLLNNVQVQSRSGVIHRHAGWPNKHNNKNNNIIISDCVFRSLSVPTASTSRSPSGTRSVRRGSASAAERSARS